MANDIVFGITLKANSEGLTGELRAAEAQVQRLGETAGAASREADGLAEAIRRIGHYGTAYLGVSQLGQFTRSLIDAQAASERFARVMEMATGNSAAGAAEYQRVSQIAQRLGLEITSTADAYAKFASAARGTAMEGEGVRQVFEQVAGVSAMMGMSADAQQGVFLALSQMMSKGVVSAEEFRQQLGERLPIAATAGAAALGVTQAEFVKLLESGQLVSEEFLPKFAAELQKMAGASGEVMGLQASLNRLSNSWTAVKQELAGNAPLQAAADGMAWLAGNTKIVAAALTFAGVAVAGYLAKMSATALADFVVGIQAKRAALIAETQAALAAAQAEERAAAIALASARSHNTLGTAHAAVAAAENAHAVAATRLQAAQDAAAASASGARVALAALGGPLGAISLLLGAGAAAWTLWGDKSRSALDDALERARELERAQQKTGLVGTSDPAVKELADLETTLAEKRAALNDAKARLAADRKNGVSLTSLLFGQDALDVAQLRQDVERLAKMAADMRAAIVARAQPAAPEASIPDRSDKWQQFYADRRAQKRQAIAELDALYLDETKRYAGNQEQQLALAREYQAKRAEIERKYREDGKAAQAENGLLGEVLKAQLEAQGMASGVAAEQVKVYMAARAGARQQDLDDMQRYVDQLAALEQDKQDIEAGKRGRQAEYQTGRQLDAERAGLNEALARNAIAAMPEGDARIEAERALAQAQETARFEVQAEAMAREWELMQQRGELTAQAAANQAQRMQVLEETHQANLMAIRLKYQTAREKFDRMSWSQQVATVAGEMERMTQIGATKYRAMFELNKVAARAKTVVNTAAGVSEALASYPPPLSFGMAALVAAEGAAQLAAINSASFGGGGSTPAGIGASGGIPSQMTQAAAPVTPTVPGGAAAPQTPVNITISVQALDPNSITDETRRRIADSLAPVLQQTFNRNGQNVAVMV